MFKEGHIVQNFNQTSFSLSLIAMILLTLGTVSISSVTNQTALLPLGSLRDKWTTIVTIATVSLAAVGIAVVSALFVRKRRMTSLTPSPD